MPTDKGQAAGVASQNRGQPFHDSATPAELFRTAVMIPFQLFAASIWLWWNPNPLPDTASLRIPGAMPSGKPDRGVRPADDGTNDSRSGSTTSSDDSKKSE